MWVYAWSLLKLPAGRGRDVRARLGAWETAQRIRRKGFDPVSVFESYALAFVALGKPLEHYKTLCVSLRHV
jgi:hypothetical protein